jgi:hypothetical protein
LIGHRPAGGPAILDQGEQVHMQDIHPIYFLRRAEEERALARKASDRFARMLHEHMAVECENRAKGVPNVEARR